MIYRETMIAQIPGLESALVLAKQQIVDAKRQQIWDEDGGKAVELAGDLVIAALETKLKLCKACEEK